jgi:tetratricopeptide (TPR) repeat protein
MSAWPIFAEEAAIGLIPEQIKEIKKKVEPVLKGCPVTDIPEEDRKLLFMAELLYPESYDLFYRHGEFLATEKADYTNAIPRLRKALDLKPKDINSLEMLATCYCALQKEADEVSCWESLREILEEDDSSDTAQIRERVMLQLERMARENEMIMRGGKRYVVYSPASGNYTYVESELSDTRLEEVYKQITNDLACIPRFKTSIIVLPPEKFAEIKPTSWAGGFARNDSSMVLSADSFPQSEPESILPAKPLVLHEYTHNIVFLAGGGRCPIWLNEGLAVYSEKKEMDFNEFVPTIPPPEKIMSLEQLEKEFIEIRSLGKESSERVHEAYQLAGLYARFIIQSYTLAAPRQILNGLKIKKPFEKLLEEVTGMNVIQFETRFRNWVAELKN